MLYKINYTKKSDEKECSLMVDHVADYVAATRKFMYWFFLNHPNDSVRIESLTQVEVIGDATKILETEVE
jgi:hypothetical protein